MLFSTAYLPSIQYIALCCKTTDVSIEAHEHFIKQTYRNRTCIASANGILDLIIPVIQPNGSKTNIKDVRISYVETWNKQHWHALVSAYNSSPFFEFYADVFAPFYEKKYDFLWDFNLEILETVFKIIGIKSQVSETSQFTPLGVIENDYRYLLSPKKQKIKLIAEPYSQVFDDKHGFLSNMSIIDLLCNVGPDSMEYIIPNNSII